MTNTKELRLSDRIEQFEDSIQDVKEEAREVEPDSEEFAELEAEWNQYANTIDKLESFGRECETPAVWTVQELNTGQTLHAENYATNYSTNEVERDRLVMKMCELAVVSSPEGVPDNPVEYPQAVGGWLIEEVLDFTAGTTVEHQRGSLQDALEKE